MHWLIYLDMIEHCLHGKHMLVDHPASLVNYIIILVTNIIFMARYSK